MCRPVSSGSPPEPTVQHEETGWSPGLMAKGDLTRDDQASNRVHRGLSEEKIDSMKYSELMAQHTRDRLKPGIVDKIAKMFQRNAGSPHGNRSNKFRELDPRLLKHSRSTVRILPSRRVHSHSPQWVWYCIRRKQARVGPPPFR